MTCIHLVQVTVKGRKRRGATGPVGICCSRPAYRPIIRRFGCKQRRFFCGFLDDSFFVGCGLGVRESKAAVVEALSEENDIRKGIVNRQYGHGGKNSLEDSTEYVEDITQQPDDDEDERQAVGGVTAEVFDDLRREDDDPTRN